MEAMATLGQDSTLLILLKLRQTNRALSLGCGSSIGADTVGECGLGINGGLM